MIILTRIRSRNDILLITEVPTKHGVPTNLEGYFQNGINTVSTFVKGRSVGPIHYHETAADMVTKHARGRTVRGVHGPQPGDRSHL